MRRPGFLGGFDEILVPKAKLIAEARERKRIRRNISGFGAFGKGFIAPPPNAPDGLVASPDGITQAGSVYMQDPRCPGGEKMTKKMGTGPCVGADCDPGEMETEEFEECEDDPNYVGLPEEPAGGFRNCAERQAARYPAPCDQRTCPTCFAPASSSPASMQEELLRLQAEQQEIQSMPTVPVQAPTASYTGSSVLPTDLPANTGPRQVSPEEQLSRLVEEHEERKALTRASSPTALYSQPRPVAAPPAAAPKNTNSLFNWLSTKLFGTSSSGADSDELDGYGDTAASNSTKTIVAILAIAGLYYSYTKLQGKNLRSPRKR